MPFGSGSILPSTVKAVKKGSIGSAGELRGDFDLSGDLGPLCANTDCGIFGTLPADCTLAAGEALPVGDAVEGRRLPPSAPMCPGTRCGSMPLKF